MTEVVVARNTPLTFSCCSPVQKPPPITHPSQTETDGVWTILAAFLGSLFFVQVLDSTSDPVAQMLSFWSWGVPLSTADTAMTLFLPVTTAPGQLLCELLGPSDIFQHVSFSVKEKHLTERAEGKGQA